MNNEILYPVLNPGNQKITTETRVTAVKGGGGNLPLGKQGIFLDWAETLVLSKEAQIIISLPVEQVEVFRITSEKQPDGQNHPLSLCCTLSRT